jgi:AcrR family transcriptional regulator
MVEKKQSVPDETVPAKAPARSRGRPRVGDAAMDTSVGREALIDATIDLLKDMPPSAITPVLVARPEVHPSLIRYYFRNRATLLVAVAEKLVERFAAQFEQSALSEGSPESRLCARSAR